MQNYIESERMGDMYRICNRISGDQLLDSGIPLNHSVIDEMHNLPFFSHINQFFIFNLAKAVAEVVNERNA